MSRSGRSVALPLLIHMRSLEKRHHLIGVVTADLTEDARGAERVVLPPNPPRWPA
jgi:hypothetical protein